MTTYTTPSAALLDRAPDGNTAEIVSGDYIKGLLALCGLPCNVDAIQIAPQTVTYHVNLHRPQQYPATRRAADILAARLRAPVLRLTSKTADVAFSVAREHRETVPLAAVVNSAAFATAPPLSAALGVDSAGKALALDIAAAPHVLIAGATGSGKSVCLNTIICSLLLRETPNTARILMIDPKKVELKPYDGIPLLQEPIVTTAPGAVASLERACVYMDRRYSAMSGAGVNNAADIGLPRVVIVIDELADLMLTSRRACEEHIIRLAQMGRAAGIHLIIATQRPTVNVLTGLIKANIPCKIALQTASIRDSINILDHKGAEGLLGFGDALLKLPDRVHEIRFQTAYTSADEIQRIAGYCKYQAVSATE